MKTPRLFAEFACDGIGCNTTVQIEIPHKAILTDADIAAAIERANCRNLGRETFFCPECANGRRVAAFVLPAAA